VVYNERSRSWEVQGGGDIVGTLPSGFNHFGLNFLLKTHFTTALSKRVEFVLSFEDGKQGATFVLLNKFRRQALDITIVREGVSGPATPFDIVLKVFRGSEIVTRSNPLKNWMARIYRADSSHYQYTINCDKEPTVVAYLCQSDRVLGLVEALLMVEQNNLNRSRLWGSQGRQGQPEEFIAQGQKRVAPRPSRSTGQYRQ
jgi:hypothetical protein